MALSLSRPALLGGWVFSFGDPFLGGARASIGAGIQQEQASGRAPMAEWLLLARHGSVSDSHAGFLGSTDVPLSARGRREAESLAQTLRGRRVDRMVASPMKRALETAEAIAAALGLQVEIDSDLREIDFGEWEGKSFHEICAQDREAVERWAEFAPDFAPPGGEAIGAFLDRVRSALGRLANDPSNSVLAVAHGGVVRHALCQVLGLSPKQYLIFDIRPASLTTLRMFGREGVLNEIRNVDESQTRPNRH